MLIAACRIGEKLENKGKVRAARARRDASGYPALRRIVLRVAAGAGLEGRLTAHVFRRSCATELVRGNANVWHVSRLLGHESLDTLQHYAKLDVTDLRKPHHRTHPRERDEEARGR